MAGQRPRRGKEPHFDLPGLRPVLPSVGLLSAPPSSRTRARRAWQWGCPALAAWEEKFQLGYPLWLYLLI